MKIFIDKKISVTDILKKNDKHINFFWQNNSHGCKKFHLFAATTHICWWFWRRSNLDFETPKIIT